MFIELDGWRAKLKFSACHFIPEHPSCGRLHGHTYAVSVRIEGERNGEFIIDFIQLKNIIKNICDRVDHCVIIAEKDERLRINKFGKEVSIEIISQKKRYVLPAEDVVFIPTTSASAEELCLYFTNEIAIALKRNGADNIKTIYVRVDEGPGQGAGCNIEI